MLKAITRFCGIMINLTEIIELSRKSHNVVLKVQKSLSILACVELHPFPSEFRKIRAWSRISMKIPTTANNMRSGIIDLFTRTVTMLPFRRGRKIIVLMVYVDYPCRNWLNAFSHEGYFSIKSQEMFDTNKRANLFCEIVENYFKFRSIYVKTLDKTFWSPRMCPISYGTKLSRYWLEQPLTSSITDDVSFDSFLPRTELIEY